ncbi:hypothetical protein [Amycolatopsis sp. NPDC021455]|uniref:hypothetical protein n=1 Tax=Amycolatopsis sp. NPDC021455 TaxID=3154901 RepID=UPI0033D198CF
MTALVTVVGGVLLGVLSNELFDVLPWIAVRMLRLAARLDARFAGEADLLLAEWEEQLEHLPGKATKLAYAVSLLVRVALRRRMDLAVLALREKPAAGVRQLRDAAGDLVSGLHSLVASSVRSFTCAWRMY